ncbi:WD40 repeat-like protein [Poronia punctata]|nr:WD40 repeat-like protein [Poronia punctata]
MEELDHDDMDGGAPLHETGMEESVGQPSASTPQGGPINTYPPLAFDDQPPAEPLELQSSAESGDEDNPDDMEEFDNHPIFLTNANPGVLAPDNPNSLDSLRFWRYCKGRGQLKNIAGTPRNELSLNHVVRPRVEYADLKGDEYDFQGINWSLLGVRRSLARQARLQMFQNYTNLAGSDKWGPSRNLAVAYQLPSRGEDFFRFRSMDLRRDVDLRHFQLRNILGVDSRTRVFYPGPNSTIRELDPTTGRVTTAMEFPEEDPEEATISTLTAEEGVLMTGGFNGSYRFRSIETEDRKFYSKGRLTVHPGGITNHVQVSSTRNSSALHAAFASNDQWFRTVDLTTNRVVSARSSDHAVNCSRLSPDKRLRVMVGDTVDVHIADAETGETLQQLGGHRDFGFACDWAPDGWTVATGNQDKTVRIWDARKWKNSKGESLNVAVLWSEMAGVRSLRFSPLGSGKRVLIGAEEADIINIFDAQTFNSKQTVDVFGELAGVSFTAGGHEVLALSSDPVRGGVLCLERCDHGSEERFDHKPRSDSDDRYSPGYDWLRSRQEVLDHPGTQVTLTEKYRQAAMAEDWFF